jgi:hypothetical protein
MAFKSVTFRIKLHNVGTLCKNPLQKEKEYPATREKKREIPTFFVSDALKQFFTCRTHTKYE